MTDGNESVSLYTRSTNFVRESVDELKKVHKPTRQETTQATLVTIVIMIFISIVLSVFDFVFRKLMENVL